MIFVFELLSSDDSSSDPRKQKSHKRGGGERYYVVQFLKNFYYSWPVRAWYPLYGSIFPHVASLDRSDIRHSLLSCLTENWHSMTPVLFQRAATVTVPAEGWDRKLFDVGERIWLVHSRNVPLPGSDTVWFLSVVPRHFCSMELCVCFACGFMDIIIRRQLF
jgi:hypothetical protein